MAAPKVRKIPAMHNHGFWTKKADYYPEWKTIRKQKRYTLPVTVFDAALARVRWLFDEFDGNILVHSSGGKDSTAIVELAAQVAREKGHLPLKVAWLDQECEIQGTVDYQRRLAYERDDIEFHWYQIPFSLDNATNHDDHFLRVWGADEPMWMREREPGSYKVNKWDDGTGNDFKRLLSYIAEQDFAGNVVLDGLRVTESPERRVHNIADPCYKWITWSTGDQKMWRRGEITGYRFHPIWDWQFSDVWAAIERNGWDYNTHYDAMFRWGVRPKDMRVSSITHDKAMRSIRYLQEVEPETWELLTRRLQGINAYSQTKTTENRWRLPYMFGSWHEYMDYLIARVPGTPEQQELFLRHYQVMKRNAQLMDTEKIAQMVCWGVIDNDSYGLFRKEFIAKYGDRARERREAARG